MQKAWDITEKEGYETDEFIPKNPELEERQKMLELENPYVTENAEEERKMDEEIDRIQKKEDDERKEAFSTALADKIEIVNDSSS